MPQPNEVSATPFKKYLKNKQLTDNINHRIQ